MRFERTGCTAPQLSVAVNPPRQRTPCLLLPPRPKDVDLLRNSVRGAAASSESVMRHAKHTSTRMNSLVCDMRVSAHCCIISLQGNEFLSGSPGLASIEQARRVSSASRLNPRTSWCEQVVRSAVALKHERKMDTSYGVVGVWRVLLHRLGQPSLYPVMHALRRHTQLHSRPCLRAARPSSGRHACVRPRAQQEQQPGGGEPPKWRVRPCPCGTAHLTAADSDFLPQSTQGPCSWLIHAIMLRDVCGTGRPILPRGQEQVLPAKCSSARRVRGRHPDLRPEDIV